MTPTFHAIALETLKPVAERRLVDPHRVSSRLAEFHFFDVSAVAELANDLGGQFVKSQPIGKLAFLPFTRTALDFGKAPNGSRAGVMVEANGDTAACRVVGTSGQGCSLNILEFSIGLNESAANLVTMSADLDSNGVQMCRQWAAIVYGALALINTPRILTCREHAPHAGLQRKMAAANGNVGKYPLHTWSEIVLKIDALECVESSEAGSLTEKARHSVRAHWRIIGGVVVQVDGRRQVIGGKEVKVKQHQRGNPALGFKRSRYRVEPPAVHAS